MTRGSEVEADLLSNIETRTAGDADDVDDAAAEAIRTTVQFAELLPKWNYLLPHWNYIITPQILQ